MEISLESLPNDLTKIHGLLDKKVNNNSKIIGIKT